MVDPARVALFIPPGLQRFKLDLFERIGRHIRAKGGQVVKYAHEALNDLPDATVPIVGCTPELKPIIAALRERKREFIYWDRGYWLRVFATWLPRGSNGGLYRWHRNSFQLARIDPSLPDDRLTRRPPPLRPWQKNGRHIVVAAPTPTYARFHGIEGWTQETIRALALLTERQIVVRDKESKRPLQADLDGAHCLIAHGSNAAVEAVILGCPVVVDRSSAAALVGLTDLKHVELPVYPERDPWLRSLAYAQFDERELVDGTLWRLLA